MLVIGVWQGVRDLGGVKLDRIVTANLDMIQHYRPRTNVLDRPAKQAFAITGHHEIMLPLLRLAILAEEATHRKAPGGKSRA